MPHKPIKMTGPRQFHLRGSKSHHPTINLAGETETKAGQKIPFGDERKKKLAWMSSYCAAQQKLAADAYSWEQNQGNARDDWIRQIHEQNAQAEAWSRLAQKLGRQPTEDEFNSYYQAANPATSRRWITGDTDQNRLNAATQAMEVDPTDVTKGQLAAAGQVAGQYDAQNTAKPGIEAPRVNLTGVKSVDGGRRLEHDASLINGPAYAAQDATSQYLASIGGGEASNRPGSQGIAEPLLQAISGGWGGDAANVGGQYAQAKANLNKPLLDKAGRPLDVVNPDSSPTAFTTARGLHDRAVISSDYNKALARGDTDTARKLISQMPQVKWEDPAARARANAATSWSDAGSQVGSTVSELARSKLWALTSKFPMLKRVLPQPIAAALSTIPLGAAWIGATEAPWGQKWEKAKEVALQLAQAVAQDTATTAAQRIATPQLTGGLGGAADSLGNTAVSKVLPKVLAAAKNTLANPAEAAGNAGRTAWQTLKGGAKYLNPRTAWNAVKGLTPGQVGTGLKNLGRNSAVGYTLGRGADSVADLTRQAYNWNDSEAPGKVTLDNEIANQVDANDAGAGGNPLAAVFTGQGKARFGAMIGDYFNNPDSKVQEIGGPGPAARAVANARRELSATRKGYQGYDNTVSALQRDPRFAQLDMTTMQNAGQLGQEQAESAGKLDYGRPINDQIGTQWLGRYSQARLKIMERQPLTPDESALMQDLTGVKPGADGRMQLTPGQIQRAGQDATLYYQMGPNAAKQFIRKGDLMRPITPGGAGGRPAVAQGAIQLAQGIDPSEPHQWQERSAIVEPPKPPQVAQPPVQIPPVATATPKPVKPVVPAPGTNPMVPHPPIAPAALR